MSLDTSTALVPTPPAAGPLEALRPELEAAAGYVADAKATNTRRAYAADWAAFQAWCAARGVAALPADPATVAAYLAGMADAGRKVSSIERALAGIAHGHRAAGQPWQKGHAGVREVVKGIRRRLGVAPSQKVPVTDDELRAIVAALDDSPAGLRDRALLLVGWFGAFRRSEIVALVVADVTFAPEGLIVHLRRSKTDQEGQGAAKGLPYAGDPALCPVRALRAWLAVAGQEGPVFRSVDKRGRIGVRALTGAAVALIVKRAVERAGLDSERFAGHSLRAGFATTAARKGRDLAGIMRQTGHKSERVARAYVRHASLFTANAAAGLL